MANNANIRMAPSQRMYTPDTTNASSNSSSMMPQGIDGNVVFSKASTPAILIKQKNPSHIFINNSGSYYFNYQTSASMGDTVHNGWDFGMHLAPGAQGGVPVRLDIQPCAWSGSALNNESKCKTGDVTFIYRGQ